MHTRGRPEDMYAHADTTTSSARSRATCSERRARASSRGVRREQLIVDPGPGLREARRAEPGRAGRRSSGLAALGRPLLVGPSRKSFLAAAPAPLPADERDWATAAAVTAAVLGGAHIVRVHAVAKWSTWCASPTRFGARPDPARDARRAGAAVRIRVRARDMNPVRPCPGSTNCSQRPPVTVVGRARHPDRLDRHLRAAEADPRHPRACRWRSASPSIVGLFYLSRGLQLETLNWLIRNIIGYVVFAAIVLLQADIRRALVHLGRGAVLRRPRSQGQPTTTRSRSWSWRRRRCPRRRPARSS